MPGIGCNCGEEAVGNFNVRKEGGMAPKLKLVVVEPDRTNPVPVPVEAAGTAVLPVLVEGEEDATAAVVVPGLVSLGAPVLVAVVLPPPAVEEELPGAVEPGPTAVGPTPAVEAAAAAESAV